MKFEIFAGVGRARGKWFWRLVSARNGKTMCVSEGYNEKRSALQTVRAIQKRACDAPIVDLTKW